MSKNPFELNSAQGNLIKVVAVLIMISGYYFSGGGVNQADYAQLDSLSLPSIRGALAQVYCVVLFAYITGYGLSLAYGRLKEGGAKSPWERWLVFYKRYLFYLAAAVLVAWAFPVGVLSAPSLKQVILALSCYSIPFWDWWYVSAYGLMLLISLPILLFADRKKGLVRYVIYLSLILFCWKFGTLLFYATGKDSELTLSLFRVLRNPVYVQIPFLIGWCWARACILRNARSPYIVELLFIALAVFVYSTTEPHALSHLLFTLLLALVLSFVKIPQKLACVLQFAGKYFLGVWLLHRFVFGYWFSGFFYSLPTPLNILLIYLASLGLTVVFEGLIGLISNSCLKVVGAFRK